MSEPTAPSTGTDAGYQFGAIRGVYIPSLLTILGVIMYLRLGWVLGQVGLFQTLVIVTLASSITCITALSIAAMATNMRVGGGGAYYIISRSLGVETGAAIGLPLFLAQAFGIAFYIAGFAESVARWLPHWPPQVIGLLTLAVLAALAYISANAALRVQTVILALIGASIVSFFVGRPVDPAALAAGHLVQIEPFWAVFAIFFPAVTGIEAGLALSGDLRNPAKALPWGTLGAVITGYVVYLAIPVIFAQRMPDRSVLLGNSMLLHDLSRWGPLVIGGLWGASLSSGLGACLGAPRTLQALARDGVLPRVVGRSFGRRGDPHIAAAISLALAGCGIWWGSLNAIAPLLTTFFLTSYGVLNLSAAFHGLIGSPAWRPEFRIHWAVSFAGAMLCLIVMFMINAGAAFLATLVVVTLYLLVRRRRLWAYWGDLRYGILMLVARFALYRLVDRAPDERTWRPNILVLSGSPTTHWHLIALADALSHGTGFLTIAMLIAEPGIDASRLQSMEASVREYLAKRRVPALVQVQTAADVFTGAQALVDSYGFGPLVPNTILLGETEDVARMPDYVQLIQRIARMQRNLILVRESDMPPPQPPARIDMWWRQKSQNAALMLALGYLLKTSSEWRDARLMLKTVVEPDDDPQVATDGLAAFVRRCRLDAQVEVVQRGPGDVFDQIAASSAEAHLVLLGMRAPQAEESTAQYQSYYQRLLTSTNGFPATALVLAAEQIDFHRIFESPT